MNVQIVRRKPVVDPVEKVTIELTGLEAKMLRALVASIGGGSNKSIYLNPNKELKGFADVRHELLWPLYHALEDLA